MPTHFGTKIFYLRSNHSQKSHNYFTLQFHEETYNLNPVYQAFPVAFFSSFAPIYLKCVSWKWISTYSSLAIWLSGRTVHQIQICFCCCCCCLFVCLFWFSSFISGIKDWFFSLLTTHLPSMENHWITCRGSAVRPPSYFMTNSRSFICSLIFS